MAEIAELVLEGAGPMIDHYDKVYDPVKERVKRLPDKLPMLQKLPGVKSRAGDDNYQQEEAVDYDEYPPPRRSNTERPRDRDDIYDIPPRRRNTERSKDQPYDSPRRTKQGLVAYDRHESPQSGKTERPRESRPRRDQSRGDHGRDRYVEEVYEYESRGPRAKSAGRDGPYGGGGRGLKRDEERRRVYRKEYYSDSESSVSPAPRDRRRKSISEQALAVLGIGGAAAAGDDERDKRRDRDRRRARDRDYDRDHDRDYNRDKRSNRPRRSDNYDDSYSQSRRAPAGYIRNGDDRTQQRGSTDGTVARRDNNSNSQAVTARSAANDSPRDKRNDDSSSESSSVCSSSEDERRIRKTKGKEYLTGALAAVATIHAAHGVYSSMEARKKRQKEVHSGQMSQEQARKKRNKARLQDAAAIGIAALGIKGAYGEWKEVQESRGENREVAEEREKNHERRVRRAEKCGSSQGGGSRTGRSNNGYRTS